MNQQMILSNNPSYIKICNYGGYLAEFYVTYVQNNSPNYDEDSGVFSVGFCRSLNIAEGTSYVNLKVEIWILGGLRVMYDGPIDVTNPQCFELHGTIFNATMDPVACNGVGGSPVPPNNSNCCCCCQSNCCCNNCCCNNCCCQNTNYYSNCNM